VNQRLTSIFRERVRLLSVSVVLAGVVSWARVLPGAVSPVLLVLVVEFRVLDSVERGEVSLTVDQQV
jgi:hypothetical protein